MRPVQETKVYPPMAPAPVSATALRIAELSQNSKTDFALRPDAAERSDIAQDLGLLGLRKMSFSGEIQALGKTDWKMSASLGATVVQPCVVTLEPVTTRIDIPVKRQYIEGLEAPEDADFEMPGDDTTESLTAIIDPAHVMIEALALALPLYPRKDGADMQQSAFTEPGIKPMTDEDARPFAGLAAMQDTAKKDQ